MKEPSPTRTYSSCNVAMLQSAGSPDDIYWYAVSINRKLLAKKLATQRHSGTEHCSYATFTSHIRSEHISSDRRPYGYGLVTVRQQCYVLASLADGAVIFCPTILCIASLLRIQQYRGGPSIVPVK